MAGEQLKDAAQLLADYADNTTGDIQAVNVRNHLIADGNDVGFAVEDDPYTLALAGGVPLNVLDGAPSIETAFRFWSIDVNNEFVQDYGSVPVAAGVQRLVTFSMQALVAKVGGGTTDYTFQIFRNGVPTGNGVTIELSNDSEYVDLRRTLLYDCVTPETLSFRVTQAGGTDLDIEAISIQAFGVLI